MCKFVLIKNQINQKFKQNKLKLTIKMKKIQSKILVFAFLAMGTFTTLTSCSKDPETQGPGDFTYENVEGKYAGTHLLNIPDNILKALSATLPLDTVTGLPTDLTKGFEDTLELRVVGGVVKVSSTLLKITIDGKLSATNSIKIVETKYAELNLGTAVKAEDATLATNKDVKFNSGAIGTNVPIELRLTAKKIGTFAIPLNITTTGSFTKISN
jgi:hypothetical protein